MFMAGLRASMAIAVIPVCKDRPDSAAGNPAAACRPNGRRSTGAAVAAVHVMFRRVYWRLVWVLGAICIREWTNAQRD
jgi:hypothetical protein